MMALAALMVAVFSALVSLRTYLVSQRAMMMAYLEPNLEGTYAYLVVKNIGKQTAKKVRFSFSDDPSGTGEKYKDVTDQVRKQLYGVATWVPDMTVRNIYAFSPNQKIPGPEKDVQLTISYRGLSRPKKCNRWSIFRRSEVFELPQSLFKHQLYDSSVKKNG